MFYTLTIAMETWIQWNWLQNSPNSHNMPYHKITAHHTNTKVDQLGNIPTSLDRSDTIQIQSQ